MGSAGTDGRRGDSRERGRGGGGGGGGGGRERGRRRRRETEEERVRGHRQHILQRPGCRRTHRRAAENPKIRADRWKTKQGAGGRVSCPTLVPFLSPPPFREQMNNVLFMLFLVPPSQMNYVRALGWDSIPESAIESGGFCPCGCAACCPSRGCQPHLPSI